MNTSRKKFDPTVSFMFFGSWVEAIKLIEQAGIELAYRMFLGIAGYCMFDEEPDFSDNMLLAATWRVIEKEADLSISNRKRQFDKDELDEKKAQVLQAYREDPKASIRDIAQKTGISKSTVDRIHRAHKAEIEAMAIADTSSDSSPDCANLAFSDCSYDKDDIDAAVHAAFSVVDGDNNRGCHTDIVCLDDNDSMGRDTGQDYNYYFDQQQTDMMADDLPF